MRRLPIRFRLPKEWDILEPRLCPSQFTIVPAERTDSYGVTRYKQDLQQVASGQDRVVFFGDSITDFWANGAGSQVWADQIALLGAADFGIGSDQAENLLWRVENGEMAGDPKVAVVEIGTNNLGNGDSVAYTTAAIEAVVQEIETISPTTKVVLMGLFPRGSAATDPARPEIAQVNEALAAWAPSAEVTFLDIDSTLTDPDGSLTTYFLDALHPNAAGYTVWADALTGPINDLLNAPSTAELEGIVEGIYQSVLGRAADQASLENDVLALELGTTATQLAATMFDSAEYDTRVVVADYETYLGRAADSYSLSAYVAAMQGGWTEAEVAEALINSDEFTAENPTAWGYIEALYQDVLDRTPSSADLGQWLSVLYDGMSRSEAAADFVTSAEAIDRAVDEDFQTILGRPGSLAEVGEWASLVEKGSLTVDQVAEVLLGSAEFAARAAGSAAPAAISQVTASRVAQAVTPEGFDLFVAHLGSGEDSP